MTPLTWTRDVLEKPYLKMIKDLRAEESVEYAVKNEAACSPGAAFGAMVAARCAGANLGLQIGYCSSYDIQPGDSFVNYASFVF
jgi:AmmeMemoRadiSam system protein B